jgi:hypothetical protein
VKKPQSSTTVPRNGKIARLPERVREEINHRLNQGHPGRMILAWLNSHPEVKDVLHRSFDGRPLNAPNLTHWKQGGYGDWQIRRQIASASSDPDDAGLAAAIANRVSHLLGARYLIALSPSSASRPPGETDASSLASLKRLHPLTRQITTLRRSELKAARERLLSSGQSTPRPIPSKFRPGSPRSRSWSWTFGRKKGARTFSPPHQPEPSSDTQSHRFKPKNPV